MDLVSWTTHQVLWLVFYRIFLILWEISSSIPFFTCFGWIHGSIGLTEFFTWSIIIRFRSLNSPIRFFWRHIHYHHHTFIDPTAFAQVSICCYFNQMVLGCCSSNRSCCSRYNPIIFFSVVILGPMGHQLSTVLFPVHPVSLAVYGFLTSIYAIAAHGRIFLSLIMILDGRSMDLNDHIKHHHYKNCNFALYWGLWDYICGTRYTPKMKRVEKIE